MLNSKNYEEIVLETFMDIVSKDLYSKGYHLWNDVEVIVWFASAYKKQVIYRIHSINYVNVFKYSIITAMTFKCTLLDANYSYAYEQTFTPEINLWHKVVEVCPKYNIEANFLNENEIKFLLSFNTLKNFPHCT